MPSTVKLNVAPGAGLFELVADEDEALADDWDGVPGPVRVAPDRVGIDCESQIGRPAVLLTAHESEPAVETTNGMAALGTYPVTISTGVVQVWTTFSGPAEGPLLELPPAPQHRYLMRVATGHYDVVGANLADYETDLAVVDKDVPDGLERFQIDFWPQG